MEKGSNYRIVKLEKGPLQRFKNQNALIKKFGDAGLMAYKAIGGKRTSAELMQDLEMDPGVFHQILSFMEESGMVELAPAAGGGAAPKAGTGEREEISAPPEARGERREVFEAPKGRGKAGAEEEVAIKPVEEGGGMAAGEFEITPIGEEGEEKKGALPEEKGGAARETRETGREAKKEKPPEEEFEIKPIGEGAEEPEKAAEAGEAGGKKEKEAEGEAETEEKAAEKPEEEFGTEELKIEGEQIAPLEEGGGGAEEPEKDEGLSPVEKIIKDKYGEVGLKVYTLIDGQRTAEEIMRETGLTESKLVEMLDFMDEEGIIKLEYPGEKRKAGGAGFGAGPEKEEEKKPIETEGFEPMVEGEEAIDKDITVKNPVEVPLRAPLNVVEVLYLRTKTLMKFGESGGKVLESINGKLDVIEIAMGHSLPLYEVADVINFLLEQRAIVLKPLGRTDIRKKYGDEGYAIYKKYGKDGVLLYELVGKDMRIKDMGRRIYRDAGANKEKLADMFIFIHQILKIDLPVDRDLLYREFEGR